MQTSVISFKARADAALADPTLKLAIDRTTGTAERKRAAALVDFPQFEAARERGKRIKDHVIEHLDHYLLEFERNAIASGAKVHWATSADEASAVMRAKGAPIVVKASGLCAGKGVVVALTLAEALAAIDDMFGGSLGAAGAEVVIEDFMQGEEASFFILTDGTTALPIGTAQDHKRAGDGDTGPNTGGMGAYSPAPVLTAEIQQQAMDEIVLPTIREMARRGTPYQGVLYAGLMIDRGYPGAYARGSEIRGLDRCPEDSRHMVFHAGTIERDGRILANGGRVLNITARGDSLEDARNRAYAMIDHLRWPEGFCRSDIGWRALPK